MTGTSVFRAQAKDNDPGTILHYFLSGATFNTFAIDNTTGVVSTIAALDFEVGHVLRY